MTGPVGESTLEPYAVETPVIEKLWTVSEEATGFKWAV